MKTSWRCLENVLKTSWRHMTKTNIFVFIKTSWRRLENAFWRCMTKANIYLSWSRRLEDVLKTSFEDEDKKVFHQDQYLVGSCFWEWTWSLSSDNVWKFLIFFHVRRRGSLLIQWLVHFEALIFSYKHQQVLNIAVKIHLKSKRYFTKYLKFLTWNSNVYIDIFEFWMKTFEYEIKFLYMM